MGRKRAVVSRFVVRGNDDKTEAEEKNGHVGSTYDRKDERYSTGKRETNPIGCLALCDVRNLSTTG